jgi:hypothetical protein
MLLYKENPKEFDYRYFYVDRSLWHRLEGEIRSVRVFVYYSPKARSHAIWIIKVTPGNLWYESLAALFREPGAFFEENEIRIYPNTERTAYGASHRPLESSVRWPAEATGELLARTIGEAGFIGSADHPIYQSLFGGKELDLGQ